MIEKQPAGDNIILAAPSFDLLDNEPMSLCREDLEASGVDLVANSVVLMYPDIQQYMVPTDLRTSDESYLGFLCCCSSPPEFVKLSDRV
jgi:hypothetical protein